MDEAQPQPSSGDSRELVESAAGGDESAVNALLDKFLPSVHGYVRCKMGPALRSKESSWDVVQSACLELLRDIRKRRYRSEREFKIWLYHAALNKVRERGRFFKMEKRDVAREQPQPATDDSDSRARDFYRTCVTPSRDASQLEEVERVEKAFGTLEEEHREIILQRLFLQLSYAEIAKQSGRTEESLRVLFLRAKLKLASAMK